MTPGPRRLSQRPGWATRRVGFGALGLGLLAVYVVWNMWWLAQARVPPSMFTALTGLPSPTTGGTRSVRALVRGDLAGSLYYHPLAVPIVVLVAVTVVLAVWYRGRAPRWLYYAWVATLLVAWVVKLLSPAATW